MIDASIAIKWVVEEPGTLDALNLRAKAKLIAPELLVAECANILWKKVRRREISREEARAAARLLQAAELELSPTRALLGAAAEIAIDLDHPAYDCLYLALAAARDCPFVTADEQLLRKINERPKALRARALSLADAARSR